MFSVLLSIPVKPQGLRVVASAAVILVVEVAIVIARAIPLVIAVKALSTRVLVSFFFFLPMHIHLYTQKRTHTHTQVHPWSRLFHAPFSVFSFFSWSKYLKVTIRSEKRKMSTKSFFDLSCSVLQIPVVPALTAT